MDITKKEIEDYLSDMKSLIRKNKYQIAKNANRQDNQDLFLNYIIDEAGAKEVLLSLIAKDFCAILQNEHKEFADEKLYVFGKKVSLLKRFGNENKPEEVPLYIKINKLDSRYVIVISFHKQKTPIKYYFK